MNSLYGTPVTGMEGASFQLNVVADNIANLNTTGFQAEEPLLAGLPAQPDLMPLNPGVTTPVTTKVGMGVQAATTERSQVQGALRATGNPLDLVIQGNGLFVVRQANGQIAYTPQLALHLQPDGQLLTDTGAALVPPIRVPAGVTAVAVDEQGRLMGETRTGATIPLGTPGVATFPAPENLRPISGTLLTESLSSGRPQTPPAGSPRILSGYQLASNVDLASQMVELIQAERMYDANTRALQTIDSLVNNVVSIPPR